MWNSLTNGNTILLLVLMGSILLIKISQYDQNQQNNWCFNGCNIITQLGSIKQLIWLLMWIHDIDTSLLLGVG